MASSYSFGKFTLTTANSNLPHRIQIHSTHSHSLRQIQIDQANLNSPQEIKIYHRNNSNSPRQLQIHHGKSEFAAAK